MSWNLYVVTKDLDDNEHWTMVVDSQTYNLTDMWAKAIPFLNVARDFDGKKCEDILLDLQIAVSDAVLNKPEYENLNPDNGWGKYKDFYNALLNLKYHCQRYPSGYLAWSG